MKKKMRRFLAMALAMTMVLQQGSTLGVLAVETEPISEVSAITAAETQISESETKAPEIDTNTPETKAETKETAAETKASESETKAPETKSSESETKAPETKAETKETKAETQASESEPKAPEMKSSESETKAETQTSESGTKETEPKAQTDETTTESESDPGAAETATEKTTESETATEQVAETESESETATELVTEELTEAETESETETETETEEPVVLETVIAQEVFQKTVEGATIPMVKYTVKVANKAAKTEAEGVSLKVLLADAVSYKKEEGETLELVSFESLGKAIESAAFENEELTEADKAAYANGGVVLWKDQKIAAGEEKTFVFFAEVKDGQTDTNALRNRWIVNGKAVAEEKIQWMNTELLEVKKELPSEFIYEDDNMIVTATLAEGTILPEGAKFVVTEEELPDEYRALVRETLDDEQILAGYVYYDMHFEVDDQEIEPENGTVAVSVAYKNPLQLSDSADETAQEDTEYKVLHLTDEQTVEEVTDNVAATDDGHVNEMGFTTDSFSGFMLIGTNDAITEKEITAKVTCPGAPEGTQFDFEFYVDGNKTNSLQQIKSENGEITFSIKADMLLNGEDVAGRPNVKLFKCVLTQVPRATINKVTFDETKYTIFVEKIENSSIGDVTFYGENLNTPVGTIEFKNTYQKAYFNRYSMAGLLNGYNVIAFTEATLGNHTVGGVLVGGDLKATTENTIGESPLLGGENPVPSYVAGEMTHRFAYGGNSGYNTTAPLYVGPSNEVWIEYTSAGQYTYYWKNTNGQNSARQDGAPVYLADYPFVNFSLVKSVLTGTMNHYAESAETCTATDGKYTVTAGTNAKITDSGTSLNLDIKDYKNATMDKNTYITVETGGKVSIDLVTYDGNGTTTGDSGQNDTSSIVWYFPNASEVVVNCSPWYGHVIAPKAKVTVTGGNYAGTMVGDIVEVYAEGHCYPYRGSVGFDLGLELEATKHYEDEDGDEIDLTKDQFEFTITPVEGNPEGDPIQSAVTAKNDENGKIVFGPFKYTSSGTYVYTVKEASEEDLNIEYDGSEYKVTVVVTGESELIADVKIEKKNASGYEAADKITFVNKEKNDDSASINLKIKKAYNGPEFPKEGFTFELEGLSDAPMPSNSSDGKKELPVTGTTEKSFGVIEYEEKGTYEYYIREIAPSDAQVKDGKKFKDGITYDSTVYKVTVKVEPDTEGKLIATATVNPSLATFDKDHTATFTNTYTTLSTSVTFGGTKTVEGVASTDKVFTFELYETGSDYVVKEGASPDQTKTTTGAGSYSFDAIPYTAESTHYYVVKEKVDTDKEGFEYDDTVYKIKVEVKDDGKGQLNATITGVADAAKLDFTNTYVQDKGSLKLTKKLAGDTSAVPSGKKFKFTVKNAATGKYYDKDGKESTDETKIELSAGDSLEIKGLPVGKYIVTEDISDAAIEGYSLSVSGDGTITLEVKKAQAGIEPVEASITNTYTQKTGALKIKKNVTVNGAATTGTEADGTYRFEVKDAAGKKVGETVEITVKNGASAEATVSSLVPGTYTVSELTDGLAKGMSLLGNNDITVTVSAGATAEVKTAEFTNNLVIVKVSKTDVATGAELEGAHIQILDKEGNVVEEWDSTKEAHEVKGLKTGETYTLKETVAPDGYTLAAETTFTLKEDGTVDSGKTTTTVKDGVLLVEDSFNKVSIVKVDESGTALAGAKLVIKDKDGKAVGESWKTDGKAHDITGLAKGSYTLSEIEAPEGYQVSADVPFEITGKETAGQVITVTMTDTTIPKSDKRSLTVTKRLRLDGVTSDVGIKDAVYYVALFSDEAKTQRVSDVKPVVFKNSTASSVTFENLAKGTYYVGETDENGTLLVSKMVNDKVIFYPEYDTTAKVEFEGNRSETASAEFTNVYVELTSGLYLSGQLTVTKKVLLNGVEGTSDETYYARVFFDKAMTSPASDVLALDLAGGTSASVTVTDLYIGETIGSSATYYVAETDKDGTPLDPDAVTEFEISIDKSEIVMDANNSAQEVVITNSYTEEETETETETEVDEKKTAPKTGDDTDFMRYLLLMAFSAGTCAVAFDRKRRKARRVEK